MEKNAQEIRNLCTRLIAATPQKFHELVAELEAVLEELEENLPDKRTSS
jgi:hypothetical protein